MKNIILKNALSNGDGGAIYSSGTLIVTNSTFTNNTATKESGGGAIYNYEGTLKIVNSRFEKNPRYDMAIYNYCEDEDNPFILTIINTTMIEDKVCVNLNGNERRLDDKRDIDLLTTEVNASIQEIIYKGNPVFINVSGIDEDFAGSITVNITNTIHNTNIEVVQGKGNTTLNLDVLSYTARFKNFISVDENAFDRDDTKPYLEINFRIICEGSLSSLEDLIRNSTDSVTLNQDYVFNRSCDPSGGIKLSGKNLTIYGNGHSIKASDMKADVIFLIENDADVKLVNLTLEGAHAVSASHLTMQTRMGGAIYVSNSNLTVINCTFKDNEAKDGFGGAIYGWYSNLNIISSKFINNTASNGNILCIWRGNAYILNCNVNQEDVHSEFDWDHDLLGSIAILNDLDATLYIPSHVLGNETSFIITHPENISAVAGLSINNNPKGNIPITNGHASADLNLDIGSYVATITTQDIVYYTDSGRNLTCTYLSATTTSNEFKVSRKADVELNVKDIVYGENEPINVNIDAEGNVTIILDGRTVKDALVINNKEINYTIPERYLNAGRHTVEVIYNGDTYVFASSKTAQFTVNKTNSILSASSLATIYNGGKYLVATLKDNAGKPIDGVNVQINLNGIVHDKITDKNGEVKLSTDALAPKTYSAIISFAGNANYVKSTKTVSVEVTKAAPKLFASIKSFKKSAKTKKYAVLLKSNQNRVMGNAWVTLKVNKKTYKVKTDKYGKATFKITSLKKKGKYGATVRFAGNAYYKAVTKKAKITIR